MVTPSNRCANFNHSRAGAPVRYCPMCGEVVNKLIPDKTCTQSEHAISRRNRNKFCVHCSEQLIKGI